MDDLYRSARVASAGAAAAAARGGEGEGAEGGREGRRWRVGCGGGRGGGGAGVPLVGREVRHGRCPPACGAMRLRRPRGFGEGGGRGPRGLGETDFIFLFFWFVIRVEEEGFIGKTFAIHAFPVYSKTVKDIWDYNGVGSASMYTSLPKFCMGSMSEYTNNNNVTLQSKKVSFPLSVPNLILFHTPSELILNVYVQLDINCSLQ